jgi:hypothetical protein
LGGDRTRFAFEAFAKFGAAGELFGENFDGDVAAKARVACAENFAHSAGAERRQDFVRTEFRSCGKGHERRDYSFRIATP